MKKLYFNFPLATITQFTLAICFAFIAIGFTSSSANAQVVVTETFTGGVLPSGWSTLKISGNDPNNDWDITNPYGNCCPFIAAGGPFSTSGLNCARYKSQLIPAAGNSAGLVTVPYDLSARGASASNISLEMFRNSWAPADNIQVYANTIPSMSGATLLTETGTSSNIIHRHFTLAPFTGVPNLWHTYTYALPAAFNTSSTYIIIVGTAAGGGHHIYIDDFTIDTYPSAMTYVSSELFFQNTSAVASGTNGALIVGMNIEMDGSLSPINCDSLILVPNGTTDLTNISNARLFYTGNSSSFGTATPYGTPVAVPGAAASMKFGSAAFPLVNGNNYFWLTYDVTGPQGNFVDADFLGSMLSDVPASLRIPTPQTLTGAREIGVSYCVPTLTVGTAWANYTNNDYVASVQLTGEVPGPVINSNLNTVWSSALPCAAGTCPFTSHPPDYESFPPDPTHTTILKEGGVYFPLSLQVGTWFSSNYIAAWIDWNGDGDFNDVVGGISEKITQSGPLAGSGTHTATVTVPAPGSPGLVTGNTVLRVREVYATSNIQPCQNGYTYGETEDFVVTITPDCTPGVKTWLGFTDDWNNPANWCDAIPSIADIAVIPGNSGTPGYTMPKIQVGVNATVKTLRIQSPDTVYVDATNSASLTVADSMIIRGALQLESGFQGTCPMGNGSFNNLVETPFAGTSSDSKMQIIYTAGELFQCGLRAGDVITEIDIPIFRRRNMAAYNNFNINYFHTAQNGYASATNAIPLGAPVNVYFNGPGESLNPIPNFGNGIHTIVLQNNMVWDGVNNMVVEFCFNKFTPTGTFSDVVNQTQTVGRNSVLIHQSQPLFTNFGWNGCNAVGPFAPQNYPSVISEYRPNLTFKYDRPYG
ncbi:MAG: hypothetical protein HKO56_01720, partial [Bacteroidia bacterium]|nr:hypothetical protein [Bacteroidia bacterium]